MLAVCDHYAPDVVIADPDLNRRFLSACQTRGLSDAALALNLCLLRLRKTGNLEGIRSKRIAVPDQEDFRFASEIAVRFLERRDQVSLDHILCDPTRAVQFDEIAARIAPGFSSFQCRWLETSCVRCVPLIDLRKTSRGCQGSSSGGVPLS